jgi:Leucine-rich repeat (LRR) protein
MGASFSYLSADPRRQDHNNNAIVLSSPPNGKEHETTLLEVLLLFGDVGGLDKRTKAALRLCNHQIKKVIDATVISSKVKPSDLDLICGSDWKLQVLTIYGSWIRDPLRVLPNALFKKFSLLETLQIQGCIQLEALPENIGELIFLKDVKIHENMFTTVPPSLGQLTSLTSLELYSCRALTLEGLAPLKQLHQLQRLKLGGALFKRDDFSMEWICKNVTTGLLDLSFRDAGSLPSTISNFKHLTSLIVENTHIPELPDSIGLLSSLQKLVVSNRPELILRGLPESVSKLTALKSLSLNVHLDDLALLQHFTGLAHLELIFRDRHYTDSQYLDVIWDLTGLKSLHLEADRSIRQIEAVYSLPDDISSLINLESLYIQKLRNLHELPESIGTLSCLTELVLWSLPDLERLPYSIGSLKRLKILNIGFCENLRRLPPSIGDLDSLEELQLVLCFKLRKLPDGIGKLDALKVLSISNCREIPDSFADLVLGKADENWSLEEVVIDCNNLVLSPKMEQALDLLKSRRVLVGG